MTIGPSARRRLLAGMPGDASAARSWPASDHRARGRGGTAGRAAARPRRAARPTGCGCCPALVGDASRHRARPAGPRAPRAVGDGASSTRTRAGAGSTELIEPTCPTPPVLVGHALGGAIAARFAAAHGDRIGRLVLVDALGLGPVRPGARVRRWRCTASSPSRPRRPTTSCGGSARSTWTASGASRRRRWERVRAPTTSSAPRTPACRRRSAR